MTTLDPNIAAAQLAWDKVAADWSIRQYGQRWIATFAPANVADFIAAPVEDSQVAYHFSSGTEAKLFKREKIIRAILSALPAQPVAVKSLEWTKHPTAKAWRSDTIVGLYQVFAIVTPGTWTLDGPVGRNGEGKAGSADEAKAAAQVDYEARIRSALAAPSQQEGVTEDKRCVRWASRGVGSDLSGFVNSRAEGEFAVEIFGGIAWLDYRPSEPTWIQVKVDAPVPVLEALDRLVRANDNLLTPAIVAQAREAALVDLDRVKP